MIKVAIIGAGHDTTTDEVILYDEALPKHNQTNLLSVKNDLEAARKYNICNRSNNLGKRAYKTKKSARAQDWAEVRPEWGLANNASFIIGPRRFTKTIDLEGRSFLHSYEWKQDVDQAYLTAILTAPVIVAQ